MFEIESTVIDNPNKIVIKLNVFLIKEKIKNTIDFRRVLVTTRQSRGKIYFISYKQTIHDLIVKKAVLAIYLEQKENIPI